MALKRPITKKNHSFVDQMVIGQGHTIMAGYIPPQVGPTTFSENYYKWTNPDKESLEKFGLFGSDIDYNTYYPDLDPEDLKPKSEEFIEPMFRLLSATIVSKNWNPTDFGANKGVLKASMPLILGQTVNCDHSTDIGNAIGSVSEVVWQEGYSAEGFSIPAGINGVLKIDGKANPRIARGILMDPPSIHSNSVTVQFRWDKSHPEMDDRDFWEKLGTYDKNGEMIRRNVTEIIRYLETSLVSHGADPFAQKVGNNGKIINPTYAGRTWNSFSEYMEDESRIYTFSDYKCDTKNSNIDNLIEINSNPNNMDKELQAFLEKIFGKNMLQLKEGQEATLDVAAEAIANLISENSKFKNDNETIQKEKETLTTEKTALTEKVQNLEAEVSNLKDMAQVGKDFIANLRETAVANYKKLKGDAVDETIITMLNSDTTGLVTLKSLNKDYEAQLEEKFPMTCAKCGSHDVNRASSVQDPHEPDKVEDFSFEEMYKKKLNGVEE